MTQEWKQSKPAGDSWQQPEITTRCLFPKLACQASSEVSEKMSCTIVKEKTIHSCSVGRDHSIGCLFSRLLIFCSSRRTTKRIHANIATTVQLLSRARSSIIDSICFAEPVSRFSTVEFVSLLFCKSRTSCEVVEYGDSAL